VWNVPTYALGELEHKTAVLRSICADIGRDRTRSCSLLRPLWRLRQMMNRYRRSARSPRNALGYGFRLHEGGLIGTPPAIVDRLHQLQELGFGQIVLSPRRGSDETLDLLASQLSRSSSSSAVRADACWAIMLRKTSRVPTVDTGRPRPTEETYSAPRRRRRHAHSTGR